MTENGDAGEVLQRLYPMHKICTMMNLANRMTRGEGC